jgi:carbamoyl-phosphate synthase small subunit
MKNARLVLEDGFFLEGIAFGADTTRGGEVVFNTSMTGYQETLTDPSYAGQILTMTASHVGNVGVNTNDAESGRVQAVGMVVRDLTAPSNYRSTMSLDAHLRAEGVPGIHGVDTRQLVKHLRERGVMRGVVSTETVSTTALVEQARAVPSMQGQDLASSLSTKAVYTVNASLRAPELRSARENLGSLHVVAYDYGLKRAMLEELCMLGCKVTVVPSAHSAAATLALKPDGILLTNGPGDPEAVVGAVDAVRDLVGKVPMLGICLGHQILALALGAKTYKMKFGHRGSNHPVMDVASRCIAMTAQNHGFAVDDDSLPNGVHVSHRNLNDNTVEGLRVPDARAFSVQHHPEASPGPREASEVFTTFAQMCAAGRPA